MKVNSVILASECSQFIDINIICPEESQNMFLFNDPHIAINATALSAKAS